MDTTPRHGDSDNVLLKKIAESVRTGAAVGSPVAPVLDSQGVERFQATFNSEDDGETILRDVSGTVRLRLGRDIGAIGPTELSDSFARLRFSATSDGDQVGATTLYNVHEQPAFVIDEVSTRVYDQEGNLVSTFVSGVTVQKTFTVVTLPSAATVGVGARSFVTDANATMAAGIGQTVVGGGSNKVPVYSDGTNWKIG